jgi:hypothetical protein
VAVRETLRDKFTPVDTVQVIFGVLLTQIAIFSSPSTPPGSEKGLIAFAIVFAGILYILNRFQGTSEMINRGTLYIGSSIGIAFGLSLVFGGISAFSSLSTFFSTTPGLAITVGLLGAFALDSLGAI